MNNAPKKDAPENQQGPRDDAEAQTQKDSTHSSEQGAEDPVIAKGRHKDNSDQLQTDDNPLSEFGRLLPRVSLFRISVLAILAAILIASLLLNISMLSRVGAVSASEALSYWMLPAGLIFLTAISLLGLFWMYFTRSVYLKDGPALVPEKWGAIIAELTDRSEQTRLHVKQSLAEIEVRVDIQAQKSDALLESFLTLQNALSAKDSEIDRLRKGHDAKVFKAFLNRFIRVDRALAELKEELASEGHEKNYNYLYRIMQDALEECGVERRLPEIGSDFRDAGASVADDPMVKQCDDVADDFKIAEVNTPAYIIEGQGGVEVIVPAKVTIFRAVTNDEKG